MWRQARCVPLPIRHVVWWYAVTNGKAVVDPSNRKRMSVALNPLTPGVHTVSWVAVAAEGHRTQGHYTFTVR